MFLLQLTIVLVALYVGSRYGSLALGAISGIALALLFITETFAAFSGLGYFIMNRMDVRNYEEMYAAILTLAAIGIIAYMALDIAERKLCPWKK